MEKLVFSEQNNIKKSRENFSKLKDFYVKYKLFVGLGLVSALLFLCPFFENVWISVAVILGLFMFSCSVDEIFACIAFMTPFSGLNSLYVVTIIMAMVIVLIKYIIDIVKKKKTIFWFPLLTTLIIVAFSTIKSFFGDDKHIETGMLLIFVFALCYFVFVYRKDIKVAKYFNALLLGLLLSAGISLVLSRFEEFKFYIFAYEGYYMRLKMTTFHMNNLALLCIFEFAYSVHSILNKSRKIWIDLVAVVFTTILGVLTLSKVFLIMIAFFVFYFTIALVVKLKTKAIKYLLVLMGLVVVLCIAGKSYIADIFDRMFLYNKGGSIWNEILNGRVDIWKNYLKDFKSCWHNVWFGVGLFKQNFGFDPHNTYLFVLHRFGIVGICAILVLMISYVMSAKPKLKFDFCKLLLLFTWLMIGLEEVVLSDQFAIYLIFAVMLLFENREKDDELKEEIQKNSLEIEKQEKKTEDEKLEENKINVSKINNNKEKRKLRFKFNEVENK